MHNDQDQERKLLINVAQDYYLSHLSIKEIADKYKISRYHINKYLTQAVDTGIVEIKISRKVQRNFAYEQEIKKQFNLKNVYVIKENNEIDHHNLFKFTAEQLQRALNDANVVGVTWGATLMQIINLFTNLNTKKQIKFVQFLGNDLNYSKKANISQVITKLSSLPINGSFSFLNAPLYIFNNLTKTLLSREASMAEVLSQASQMDLLIASIARPKALNINPWKDNLSSILGEDTDIEAVAGLSFGRPYDVNGNFVNLKNDKAFGLTINEIMSIPKRICIVVKESKNKAVLGAMRGGMYTDYLITDKIAKYILDRI
ncbi:MAG: hypothetical protein IAA89_02115 [Firmicutes bacterium]|uniref:Sugar-binding domain-containing protein n=1 Tax=Candidatus Gallilactobacillus intestinavium TaxID=2840838 RepID=A0A9D9H860_9LACO|nr:hypothetical protein [Candidatus Gallilactobacillus intestinavium]